MPIRPLVGLVTLVTLVTIVPGSRSLAKARGM